MRKMPQLQNLCCSKPPPKPPSSRWISVRSSRTRTRRFAIKVSNRWRGIWRGVWRGGALRARRGRGLLGGRCAGGGAPGGGGGARSQGEPEGRETHVAGRRRRRVSEACAVRGRHAPAPAIPRAGAGGRRDSSPSAEGGRGRSQLGGRTRRCGRAARGSGSPRGRASVCRGAFGRESPPKAESGRAARAAERGAVGRGACRAVVAHRDTSQLHERGCAAATREGADADAEPAALGEEGVVLMNEPGCAQLWLLR